ncbi:MAG TPA: hypothetical protein VFE62_00465 [Gemmataceae bacterium]|nr:hypothetical protein [Gemmataceae bacterium]
MVYFGRGTADSRPTESIFQSVHGIWLFIFYVAIFVFAEAAFALMAMREYLQDLLGQTDTDLILGKRVGADVLEKITLRQVTPGGP